MLRAQAEVVEIIVAPSLLRARYILTDAGPGNSTGKGV